MTALYIIGGIVIGLVVIIAVLGMLAPKEINVDRSITINKPVQEMYDYLRVLKNMDNWSPWNDKDPNMERGTKGTDGEVGNISWWKGNKQVGEGEQEVMKLTPTSRIDIELRFLKPWKAINQVHYALAEENGGTKVTWAINSPTKFPMSIFMLFMNMDKALGKDFEDGLNRLKAVHEG